MELEKVSAASVLIQRKNREKALNVKRADEDVLCVLPRRRRNGRQLMNAKSC